MADHMARIGELQARIRTEHDRLQQLDPADEQNPAVVHRILDTATELLDLEERLPILLDEPRRRLSLLVVRISGAVAAGFAGALMLTTLLGNLNRWWNLVLVPLVGIGLAVALARVRPAGGHHREQRTGAATTGIGAVLAGLAVLGVLPGWGWLLAGVTLVAGLALVFGGPARMLGDSVRSTGGSTASVRTGGTPGNPGATPGNPGATPGNPGATLGDPGATPGNPGATPGDPGQPGPPTLSTADTGEIPMVIDLDAGQPTGRFLPRRSVDPNASGDPNAPGFPDGTDGTDGTDGPERTVRARPFPHLGLRWPFSGEGGRR